MTEDVPIQAPQSPDSPEILSKIILPEIFTVASPILKMMKSTGIPYNYLSLCYDGDI